MHFRILALVGLAVVAYWSAMSAPFVLDDRNSILENRTIRQLQPLSVPLQPPDDTPVARRPLVNLSFAANYALDGLDPTGYRIVNLAIHLLAAVVLFGIVRRTLQRPLLAPLFGDTATGLAWFAAALWAVHPLNSEVVNYVTQRTQSLMGLAYLLTFYCAIRAASTEEESGTTRVKGTRARPKPRSGRTAQRWELAAVACCIAGTFSKESIVTAPVAIALYDRAFLFGSFRAAFAKRRRLYLGLALSWGLLAILMVTSERTSVGFDTGVTPWVYLLNQARVVTRYLSLTIWPRPLVVDYGLPTPLTLDDVIVPAFALTAAAIATIVLLIRAPRASFGAVCFFLFLAPTSSFVPIATEVGAERRMYLPLAAVIVAVAAGSYLLLRRVGAPPAARTAVAVALCLAAAWGTHLRSLEYRDTLVLAQANVERWPSGRTRFFLASELMKAGRTEEGLAEFRRSAEDYPGGRYALGVELVGQGRTDEGIVYLRQFMKLAPADSAVPAAHDIIGRVRLNEGRLDEAADEFGRILARQPRNVRALVLLGEVRLRQERFSDSIRAYVKAREIDRTVEHDPAVLAAWGLALVHVGRLDDAAATLRQAAVLRPTDPERHKVLGRVLAMSNRLDEAIRSFERAVQLAPADRQAQELLAAARHQAGRTSP